MSHHIGCTFVQPEPISTPTEGLGPGLYWEIGKIKAVQWYTLYQAIFYMIPILYVSIDPQESTVKFPKTRKQSL